MLCNWGVGVGGGGDFKEQPRVPCGPAPERRGGGGGRGERFIFTNVPVLHTSCLHLQVKKVSLLKTHLNLPSSMRLSGPPDS